jgi:amino acid transporter
MVSFAFGWQPPYNAVDMSKWTASIICIVVGIFVIWGIIAGIQSIFDFYKSYTTWFWIILIVIILGVIYFFTRNHINTFIRGFFTPKPNCPSNVIKPETTDTKSNNNKS